MAMSAALKEKRAALRKRLQSRTVSQLKSELEKANVRGLSSMNKKKMIEAVIAVRVGPKTPSKQKGSGHQYPGAGKGRDWHGEGPFRLYIIKDGAVYADLGPYAAARGAIADAKTLLRQAAPVGKYVLSNKEGRPEAEMHGGVDGYRVKAGPLWRPGDEMPDLLAVIHHPTKKDGTLDKVATFLPDVIDKKTPLQRGSMRLNKGRRNAGLNEVRVKFKNSKHNYTTDVSAKTTAWDAYQYFVGKHFDVGGSRTENMQKVTGIDYNGRRVEVRSNSRTNKNVSFTTRSGEKVSFKTKKNAGKKMARTSSQIIKAQTSHARSSLTTAQHAALNSLQYQDSLQDFNPATVISLLRRGLIKKGRGNTYSLTAAGKNAPKGGGRIVDEGIYSNPTPGDYLTPCETKLSNAIDRQVVKILKGKSYAGIEKVNTKGHFGVSFQHRGDTYHLAIVAYGTNNSWAAIAEVTLYRDAGVGQHPRYPQVWQNLTVSVDGRDDGKRMGWSIITAIPSRITNKWKTKGRSNPRSNHHLVKGEHVKWSQQGILNVGWAGPHDKGRVVQATKTGYVVDWGKGRPMPVPDKWLVDARSTSDDFPGTDYRGKTPRRKNASHAGDWPAASVLEAGEVYIDKIDALMEQNKNHPNYNKAMNRWQWAVDATGSGNIKGAKRAYEAALALFPRRNEGRWVRGVVKEMEEHGTVGAFTKQARNAGYKNTMEFARKVMDGWDSGKKTVYNKKTRRRQKITMKTMRRANFALNV